MVFYYIIIEIEGAEFMVLKNIKEIILEYQCLYSFIVEIEKSCFLHFVNLTKNIGIVKRK